MMKRSSAHSCELAVNEPRVEALDTRDMTDDLTADGRAVEHLLRAPAYFAPLLRLTFRCTALMCAFGSPNLPNATPLQ
jgi:hypothetical protein